jgi:hypothetical protein
LHLGLEGAGANATDFNKVEKVELGTWRLMSGCQSPSTRSNSIFCIYSIRGRSHKKQD